MATKHKELKSLRKVTFEVRVLELALTQGLLRAKDLKMEAIPSIVLTRLTLAGKLERVGHGVYRLPQASISESDSLQIVARKTPSAVFCLTTALQFHGLTTQLPRQVWIAMQRGSHTPKFEYPPLQMIQVSQKLLHSDVEIHLRDGVKLNLYSVSRTVVDCFKHRSKVGLDVALEALRDALAQRKTSVDEIWRVASKCRAANVMRPYLEAIA
jgi:predicted transcriptional regulator of viral defense system